MKPSKWKRLGAGVVLSLVALTSGTNSPNPQPGFRSVQIPQGFQEALAELEGPHVDLNLLVGRQQDVDRVQGALTQLGAEVIETDQTFLRARVPAAHVEQVLSTPALVSIGVDTSVTLPPQGNAPTVNQPMDGQQTADGLPPNGAAVGLSEFLHRSGTNGQGIVVAIVDTGIDPGHRDLQRTPDGRSKVIDWKDWTGEGQVSIQHSVPWAAQPTTYTAPNGRTYRIPAKPAGAGDARFGFWAESLVRGKINRDLDRNGLITDRFGVLLVDSNGSGYFDTVYVDTNDDGSFLDEKPLREYRIQQDFASMGRIRTGERAAQRTHFVVSDLDPNGFWVNFGFDGHGHGTEMAGVVGASGPGGMTGVAPGVQLMALKVVRSEDDARWSSILAAVRYAARNGAHIINVSLGSLPQVARFDATASESLNQIAQEYGVLIIMAADNVGPGLSSGATLGSPSRTMTVGAYYSPAMWMRDYGFVVPREGILPESGMGPRSDGALLPNVVAPGGSPTTVPSWLIPSGYTTAAGTSVATASASGAASLLMAAAKASGYHADYLSVKRAMETTARPLSGIDFFEQGYGLVQLPAALEELRRSAQESAPTGQAWSKQGGLLARSYTPGGNLFSIVNQGQVLSRMDVTPTQPWIKPTLSSLSLPPLTERHLAIAFDNPTALGVHAGFIRLEDRAGDGSDLQIPVTLVNPHRLENRYQETASVEVGRYRRFFIEVKPGLRSLSIAARIGTLQGSVQGTARMYVFSPDGQRVAVSDSIGLRGQGLTTLFRNQDPLAGVWEVVLYGVPDEVGDMTHAQILLDVQTEVGYFGAGPVQLTATPGTTVTMDLPVSNPADPFVGRVITSGLFQTNMSQDWTVVRSLFNIDSFVLRQEARLVRLELANPLPANVDLDLTLYREVPGQGLQHVQVSANIGTSREVIEIANLPPGNYVVSVSVNGARPSQYQYRRMVALAGDQMVATDNNRLRQRGERWTVPLQLQMPSTPGRYYGHVVVMDTNQGRSLSWIPVEISVGEPALRVTPMVTPLRIGQSSMVTLEIRSAERGNLIDGTVVVDGRTYVSRNGRIQVPVLPRQQVHTIEVRANWPGYQFLEQQLSLPVQLEGQSPIPTSDSTQENSNWRRKVESQLR